ncbi:MAG: glycosyltransferase family 4 protein [Novosphingobium aromaticivorans]|jgi:glycosyltransferase involved in cell wall biosynthesis|nr:glycosyltransferase family 4 protein [Novosphingobium aromaticivorans]
MTSVNVIYHHFPHYRAPVLRELTRTGRHDYRFWGSHEDIAGIKAFKGDDEVTVHPLRFRLRGRFWMLGGYAKAVLDPSAKALIVLGNPNMPATIAIALLGRLTGKRVLFWAHGWLRQRPSKVARLRNLYFRLADRVLVYGERAARIAVAEGFPAGHVKTIYNSLDYERAQKSLEKVAGGTDPAGRPQALFADPDRPVLICTARITPLCRFDVLLQAARLLQEGGRPVNVLLVGDGPEKAKLEAMARDLGVSVCFYGACYDEDELARLIYWSDITVSPGKIGLTAMHTLTYGTPAITHGDLDAQMPEVEAIEPGVSGLLFQRNDPVDLARAIGEWLDRDDDRSATRAACQAVIAQKWNPANQRRLIDLVIDELMEDRAAAPRPAAEGV